MKRSISIVILSVMTLVTAAAQGNSFAFGLFRNVVSEDASDLVFISPLSASLALSMTAAGADEATQQEMVSTLGFDCSIKDLNRYSRGVIGLLSEEPEGVQLNVANSIWVSDRFPLKNKFIRTAQKNYDAAVANLDFSDPASPSVINSWCSENTAGRIDKMIESIDPATQLYLLNALYFKGLWTTPFDPVLSREETFHGDSKDSQVKFMHANEYFPYYMGEEAHVLELPYGDGSFVMDVLLPVDGVSADELVSKLDEEVLASLISRLQTDRIRVSMPSFKAEYEITLNGVLRQLGMNTAFTPSADFSNMSKEPLMISEVKQKTFIEVNEEGSEAAAVTSVAVMRTSLAPEPLRFTVDRPFVFLIRERTSDTVLFLGLVRNI